MKATTDNFWKLDNLIQGLQSQIEELYYRGDWNVNKSVIEENLQNEIDYFTKMRNAMYSELDNSDVQISAQCR